MTSRNKALLFSSILLAVLVIVSTILLAVSSPASPATLFIFAVVILISILSVIVVYFTKIRKRKYAQLLNPEFYREYEIIKDAVANSQLPGTIKKEIDEDILDLLLSAQKEGKAVNAVIDDPEKFSQDIILSFARPAQLNLSSWMDSFIAFPCFVIGINLMLWLEDTAQSFFAIKQDLTMFAFVILVCFVIIPITKKVTSTRSIWGYLIPVAAGIAFILLMELSRALMGQIEAVRNFLDGSVKVIPNEMVLAILLFSIPIFYLVKYFARRRIPLSA